MSHPILTARHETPVETIRSFDGPVATRPGVTLEVTYPQGSEQQALALLDRTYADVKRQITGMATIIHATHEED